MHAREVATILAALRYWQATDRNTAIHAPEYDIATDGGKCEPLGKDDIDTLCERLNTVEGTFWVVLYHHRHGVDVGIMWQDQEPTEEEMIASLGDAWEGPGSQEDREDERVEAYGPYHCPPEAGD